MIWLNSFTFGKPFPGDHANDVYPIRRNGIVYVLKKSAKLPCPNRILAEFEFLKKAVHPFLIRMLFAFETTDFFFFGYPLYRCNLTQRLEYAGRKLTEHEVRYHFACIVLALEYVHGQGWIHRDIKPDNIFIDCNKKTVLADVGLICKGPYATDFSGTPDYRAPEITTEGIEYTYNVDVYSLAITIMELLTGVPLVDLRLPYVKQSRKGKLESLLRQMSIEDPKKRFDIKSVKESLYFSKLDFSELLDGAVPIPLFPLPQEETYEFLSAPPFDINEEPYQPDHAFDAYYNSGVFKDPSIAGVPVSPTKKQDVVNIVVAVGSE